tara:strand:+ start:666 stop:782 length:117 start_codon:yes stop_codon:yes gene_type:complete
VLVNCAIRKKLSYRYEDDSHVCDNEKEWLIGLANDMGL